MRLFLFCLLVLVLVGALAFYRHWVNVSTDGAPGDSKSSVTITVDRDKVKEDVNSVKKAATNAENSIKNDVSRSQGSATVTGKVADIDPNGKHLTLKNDKESVELQVTNHTEIRVGDKVARLADLHVGETATASYSVDDKEHPARTITVAK